jgi:predicted GH43/DUF377 family glycosyl hydrolase
MLNLKKPSMHLFNFIKCSLIVFMYVSLHAHEDLENMAQDFILETKKIEIPEHPYAFNASIVRWQGSLLMSFRIIISEQDNRLDFIGSGETHSRIGLIWLDEDFRPISQPQLLEMNQTHTPSRAEDARLIIVDNQLYIIYSNNEDEVITEGGFRVYVAQLEQNGSTFTLKNQECLDSFEGQSPHRREKNWVPFNYNGHLTLAYSLSPHRIFHPLLGRGKCQTIALSDGQIHWSWGELRGGTPALKIDNQYLAFFHTVTHIATQHSHGKVIPHYFMGAYTFSLEPPFQITHISQEPIIGKGFYKGAIYKPYWHPVRVIFPCGFIFDDSYIWITYGRQDHEIWISKLDRKKLFQSLTPVYSEIN